MIKKLFRITFFWVVFVMIGQVKAEDVKMGGWTLFFASHSANHCIVFEDQEGDTGSYMLRYKVFEARGGQEGEEKGKFKTYHDEKGRLIVKLEAHRIVLGKFDGKGEKVKIEGNMFDQDGAAMWPGSAGGHPTLGDDVIDGVGFLLLKGKHTDPDKIDEE
ncbi:MAG: hypothetical protein ABJQ29_15190 [Luteolibacter sp.]